jgi:hypothetical protein
MCPGHSAYFNQAAYCPGSRRYGAGSDAMSGGWGVAFAQ